MLKMSHVMQWLLVLQMAAVYLPVPMPGQIGAYNPYSQLYMCFDRATCIHEQGHKLDQSLGWPSQSDEFRAAVTDYVVSEFSGDPSEHAIHVLNILMTRDDGPYRELYADVWMWARGNVENVPEGLRGYYD